MVSLPHKIKEHPLRPMKIITLFKASALVGSLMIGMSETRAALIFSENFEDGLGAWNQVGSWSTATFDLSTIAQNAPGAAGSSLTHSFTATAATSFSLNFDFGWLFGPAQTIALGVALLDDNNNGYTYNIRMEGDGFSYELGQVVNGVAASLGYTGTASYGSNQPLVDGSLTWDGTALTGWAGGENQISRLASSNFEFSKVVLLNVFDGGGAQVRFDNISLDAVPEPSSALLLGSAVVLGAILYRRKAKA